MTTQNQNYSEKANKLSSELWEMANALRGNIDSSKFKDYIFGIIFYRFLSEKVEAMAKETFEDDGCMKKPAMALLKAQLPKRCMNTFLTSLDITSSRKTCSAQ